MSNAKDAATVAAFKTAWAVTGRLPERTARAFFAKLADRTYRKNSASVRQLRKNYSRVVPDATAKELDDLTRDGVHSYMRYWCDAFRLPSMSAAQILSSLRMQGEENVTGPLGRGEGLLLIGAHAGNWDLTGAFGARSYAHVTTVAEKLSPRKLFDEFTKHRSKHGIEILATGEPGNIERMVSWLEKGTIVGLMGDRDVSRKGVTVNLFGAPAKLPAGSALLSLKTGIPIRPIHMYYQDGFATSRVDGPLPSPDPSLPQDQAVQELTQTLADALAEGIARNPADWHMMQPVWVEDLDPR